MLGRTNIRVALSDTSKGEVAANQRKLLPLRLKLVLILLLGILPLAVISLPSFAHFSILQQPYVIGFVLLASLALLFFLLDYAYVQPVKDVFQWLRLLRESEYKTAPLLPITSNDEHGDIARELSAFLNALRLSEERVQTLAKHKRDTTTIIEHQLRSPLTALLWSLKDAQIPEEMRTALARLEATVRTIVETAQIEEGKFGYVFSDVDLVQVIEGVIRQFKQLADARGVSITFNRTQGLPPVRADKDRIATVIENLLSNAISYTPQGGVVTITLQTTSKGVGVSIQDTGVGIPREELPLLFNKMFRGERARRMRAEGSGLGLYVARNILEVHNAALAIKSDGVKGTEVLFELQGTQELPPA